MMSSPNLLGILKRVVRYVGILSDAASLAVTEDHDGCRMTLELFGGGQPVPRQRFEFDLMTFLSPSAGGLPIAIYVRSHSN